MECKTTSSPAFPSSGHYLTLARSLFRISLSPNASPQTRQLLSRRRRAMHSGSQVKSRKWKGNQLGCTTHVRMVSYVRPMQSRGVLRVAQALSSYKHGQDDSDMIPLYVRESAQSRYLLGLFSWQRTPRHLKRLPASSSVTTSLLICTASVPSYSKVRFVCCFQRHTTTLDKTRHVATEQRSIRSARFGTSLIEFFFHLDLARSVVFPMLICAC